MSEAKFILTDAIYDVVHSKICHKLVNGRVVAYSCGYTQHRDGTRTNHKQTELSSMGWSNNEPFTEIDAIKYGVEVD